MPKNTIMIYAISASAETALEAMAITGKLLTEEGYGKASFVRACQEREKLYPTGLPFDYPVAIPHASPDHVNKDAICFARLNQPVVFQRIDDPDESIVTPILFNLAISDGNAQLEVLQALMDAFADDAFMEACHSAPMEGMCELIRGKLRV